MILCLARITLYNKRRCHEVQAMSWVTVYSNNWLCSLCNHAYLVSFLGYNSDLYKKNFLYCPMFYRYFTKLLYQMSLVIIPLQNKVKLKVVYISHLVVCLSVKNNRNMVINFVLFSSLDRLFTSNFGISSSKQKATACNSINAMWLKLYRCQFYFMLIFLKHLKIFCQAELVCSKENRGRWSWTGNSRGTDQIWTTAASETGICSCSWQGK